MATRRQRPQRKPQTLPVGSREHPHNIPSNEDYPFGRGGVYDIPGDELTFGRDPGRISRFKEPKRGISSGS